MTGEELAQAPTIAFTMTSVPRLMVEAHDPCDMRILMRSQRRAKAGLCYVLVLLDGRHSSARELAMHRADELLAVEVYPGIDAAPRQYLRPSDLDGGAVSCWAGRSRDSAGAAVARPRRAPRAVSLEHMLSFLARRRRARLRAEPVPDAWRHIVERNVPLFHRLPAEDREELLGHVQVLLAEKHFEGCGGLVLTDEHRVTIAAWASFLLLHREADYFPRLRSILVYPTAYVIEGEHELGDGIVFEGAEEFSGHTQERLGAVLLNWRDVKADARDPDDGVNLVLHELAHQLDFEDGDPDGAPALEHGATYARWRAVLSAELARLRRDVKRGRDTVLDPYGAEDPVEFFAVATEAFFETPALLRDEHPTLYEELRRFYRQDPASWVPPREGWPWA